MHAHAHLFEALQQCQQCTQAPDWGFAAIARLQAIQLLQQLIPRATGQHTGKLAGHGVLERGAWQFKIAGAQCQALQSLGILCSLQRCSLLLQQCLDMASQRC